MGGAPDPLDPGIIGAVTALAEPLRRRLLGFVRAARRPVTREEAATAVGISRKLAAFHLDKLVDAGLLRPPLNAVPRRRVGRRPKFYEPADTGIQISIPTRRHEVLAEILTQALLTEDAHGSAKNAAAHASQRRGYDAAALARKRLRPARLGPETALTLAAQVLADYGFEPDRVSETCVRLRNCPFHPIAQAAPELICRLNHAFMQGAIEGLQTTGVQAVLRPNAGECCVELRARAKGGVEDHNERHADRSRRR